MTPEPGDESDQGEKVLVKVKTWKAGIGKFFAKLVPGKINDVKYFRRLICCKFKEQQVIDDIINALLAIGFTDITNEEVLGRRGSRTMLQHVLDDHIHRLHIRIHIIDDTGYILAHKEPLPSANVEDLIFHIRGLFERIGRKVNSFFTRLGSARNHTPVDYNEKAELSDYEQGCRLFRDMIKERKPVLFQSLDFYLDERDFLAFSLKFGNVGKILPIELLMMDLDKNMELVNQQGIAENIKSILEVIGLPPLEKLPVKEKLAFIKNNPALANEMETIIEILFHNNLDIKGTFTCIFSKNGLGDEIIRAFVEFNGYKEQAHVLVIYQEEGCTVNENVDRKKLRKKGIHASHVHLHAFKTLFEKFLNAPFSVEALLEFIDEYDTITDDNVNLISRRKLDIQQTTRIVLDVLDYLGNNPGWHQIKHLKQSLLELPGFAGITDQSLDHIFDFLKNPLLELVKTRNNSKEIAGIENREEFKLKLNNMKKMLGSIDLSS